MSGSPKEEWRDIKGLEGYQISNLGNVRTIDRVRKAAFSFGWWVLMAI